jgi:adenosylcobyric acid synthase
MALLACGINPHTDMNPVLLKPNSDKTAQVIIQGRALKNLGAKAYHVYKKEVMPARLITKPIMRCCSD